MSELPIIEAPNEALRRQVYKDRKEKELRRRIALVEQFMSEGMDEVSGQQELDELNEKLTALLND